MKVKYARLKLPRMISIPIRNRGVKTIVDGTAFSTTYHSYFNHILEDDGYEFGYELPLKAEIFKHARNDKTTKYVAVQPVYYVAALNLLNTDFKAYYLASYQLSNTCDWKDDLSIEEVKFGPTLLSELRRLDQ